jgi:hypothetical protein
VLFGVLCCVMLDGGVVWCLVVFFGGGDGWCWVMVLGNGVV